MRHVLIVEDNVLKEARIRDVLSLIPEIEFTVCRSVKAAYPLLEVQQWNLILLDMSFQVSPDSGTEIKKNPSSANSPYFPSSQHAACRATITSPNALRF